MKKKHKQKKSVGITSIILINILISVISILLYNMYQGIDISTSQKQSSNNVEIARASTLQEVSNNIKTTDIIESVSSCVVGISKIKNTGNSIFLKDSTEQLGLGTGFIVSENGYILTNQHVVGNKYSSCYVTLENGESHKADVVWADVDVDLAIIKVNLRNLNFVTLGTSENIKPGEMVYAIGNPIGFEFKRTVTAGIISAINRTIKIDEDEKSSYMEDLLQTDATINPGNSGGPLINYSGEVIGINSVKITSAEGIGFAIPINIVKPIVDKFINTGNFDEGYIGIFGFDKEVIPYMDSNIKLDKGIYVAQISTDGPCYNSGLRVGDIIVKIDEKDLNKMVDLRSYIYTKEPGEDIVISVIRGNTEIEIKIKLGKRL